jgi:hypothetical protein
MRGGYGSRGVCRLIRVFLVRFFFRILLRHAKANASAAGKSILGMRLVVSPGGIVPRFWLLINCIPQSQKPSCMASTFSFFHREIYYVFKHIYAIITVS